VRPSILHRPYLLPHEHGIRHRKADHRDGNEADDMGDDHVDALSQGQKTIKPGQREPLQGAHEHEGSSGLSGGIDNNGGRVIIELHRGDL